MKQWFYGIYGIEFVWRGSQNDPMLVWHKKQFNYYIVENAMWDIYREGIDGNPDANDFVVWVKKNARIARDILQNLYDNGVFYENSELLPF